MNYQLLASQKDWAETTYEKMRSKLHAECLRMGEKIPNIPVDGVYPDNGSADLCDWVNGFWGGLMWQMYHATHETLYRDAALRLEERLDGAFDEFSGLHHDVGFMWLHTSVAHDRIEPDARAKTRGLHAATLLAGRYNPNGEYLSAWNENRPGWMIIDSMMNVPLLYWATQETNDPRYEAIALRHVETLMRLLVRGDGSVHHIAVVDPVSGELVAYPEGQGYASGSSWSRGQAWAVYGFAISYRHQHDIRYLETAKAAAHYFLSNVSQTGYIPLVDFRAPAEPQEWDSTAAVCAACGMLEISLHVPEHEKSLYIQGALRLLQAVTEKFVDWDETRDGILGGGTVAYHRQNGKNVPIIYGDYFLLEALLRLLGKDIFIW